MDPQNTIPSQLSPDTIPSVLSTGADNDRGLRRSGARNGSSPLLGRVVVALVLGLGLLVVVFSRSG